MMKNKLLITGLLSSLALFIISCGDTNTNANERGVFLDSKVEGLAYNCLPSKLSGFTLADGGFSYKNGDSCTFSIGTLTLGSASANAIITPLQLFQAESFSNENVLKTSSLLLSLDNDLNASNGIGIDKKTSNSLNGIDTSIELLTVAQLEEKLIQVYPDRKLVDSEIAIEHLHEMLDLLSEETFSFTLDQKLLSGKKIEFTNSNGETHNAIFHDDGRYEDEYLSCEAQWTVDESTVTIDKSKCQEEEEETLEFHFYENPTKGALLGITSGTHKMGAIITEIMSDNLLSSDWRTDRDYKHITFVNQTNMKICIQADLRCCTKDKAIFLDGKEAKYIEVKNWSDNDKIRVDFTSSKDACDIHKDHDTFDKTYTSKFLKTEGVYYIGDDKIMHTDIDVSGCDMNASKPAILFAHGLHATKSSWSHFNNHIKKNWRVFRTNVSGNGSVKKRAHMLNHYIEKIVTECNITENSLRVVGHSMGGLDLRYILSSKSDDFNTSQRVIEKSYSLATPHRGSGFGDVGGVFMDDGVKSCSVSKMNGFNKLWPYQRLLDHNKSYLAIRFHCKDDIDISDEDVNSLADEYPGLDNSKIYVYPADGVVKVRRQIFDSLPYAKILFKGKHTTSAILKYGDCKDCTLEQKQSRILDLIIKDGKDGYEIPHYR